MKKLINSLDIETFLNKDIFIPYCISIFLYNNNKSFYYNKNNIILDCFIYIFENIEENATFYVHNLKFDGTIIIFELSKFPIFRIGAIIENSSFYLISIEKNKKKIEIRCSYKILPLSLEKISIGFNIVNKKMDYPFNFVNEKNIKWRGYISQRYFKSSKGFLEYNKTQNLMEYTIKYCENDALITKIFVEKINKIFIENFKIDIILNKILSTPSLSFYTFYKKFNIKKIEKTIKKDKELYIRDSYFGGRCEVFGNCIKENVFHFDFPGMYGLCMKEKNAFGNSKFYYNIKKNNELEPGFYNIDWESDLEIPILPHHNQISNKLLFCNGKGNGTYWFEEINLFKKYGGTVKNINSALIYEKFDFIFKEFVEFFEKFRKINQENKILGKLIINSFYGRTGLSIKEEYSIFINSKKEYNEIIELSDKDILKIKKIEEINNIFLITFKIDHNLKKYLSEKNEYIREEKNLNIAIASSVSSKARIKLYEAFIEVKKNNGRILYCDTDSVFAEFNKKILGEKMGDIYWDPSKEDTEIIDSVFILPKTYGIKLKKKEIIKIKGITRNYINFEELKSKFYRRENFIAKNLGTIRYKDFKIEYRKIDKEVDLLAYDKRLFDNELKKTRAYIYNKGSYE